MWHRRDLRICKLVQQMDQLVLLEHVVDKQQNDNEDFASSFDEDAFAELRLDEVVFNESLPYRLPPEAACLHQAIQPF